ncbi:MAG: lipopolysaccharide heptosyltransferase II [Candidatus Omnitrophica bacterium]|nr:lipopolysaccharide heptosyltransferase II [Candidatus Omnitrophota bacterium]
MHILQLVPALDVGGVERGVLDLARGLISRGHRVSVVSSGGRLVEELMRLGAKHYTIPVNRKSPWSILQAVPTLTQLIREAQVDLVHARSRVPAWAGFLACRRTGIPFLTTCHGFYAPHPASRVMTWGRTVIAPSEALGRYLIDQFHLPPERLRIIPRGVDLTQFEFRQPRPRSPDGRGEGPWRIGVIGRLTALKGHEIALHALQQLHQQGVPATLCIIGGAPPPRPRRLPGGQLRLRLVELAQSLGVEQAVEWQGARGDVPACLRGLDVVLVPSVYPESFGRSVLESQAVGVPVIASRLGALAEVIEDGRTGLLVPPRDPGAIARAVRQLMDDDALRALLIEQGRRRVEERFTVDRMVDDTLALYQECLTAPRVLIWKLSALGDVVLATPSLRAIRRRFPDAFIALAVGRPVYDAVARCPHVNEVVVYDPTRKDRGPLGAWRFARRLKRAGFDRSIDLQNSRLTHALAWLAGIPTRVGYDRRWGRLLSRPVALPRAPMSPVSHQQPLLQAAGVALDGEALELWPSETDEQQVAQLLHDAGIDPSRPLIGVHPGGSARWATKRWEPARWAALCDRLAEQGCQVVVTGSPAEAGLGEQLLRLTKSKPIVAVGKTRLMELACLIRRCQAFVTLDSAPLHLAAAMGTPAVALFGPTDPARHVPPAAQIRVLKRDVFCSPCYSTRCRTITHACMKRITVEEVTQAITDLMKPTQFVRPVEPV